jgi:hypothetical protein
MVPMPTQASFISTSLWVALAAGPALAGLVGWIAARVERGPSPAAQPAALPTRLERVEEDRRPAA